MPIHPFDRPRGRVETFVLRSKALQGNLLDDPAERAVAVYLPPGYDDGEQDYPLLVDLAGFTGSGLAHALGWKPFEPNVPQRLERLVAEGRMGPVVCVFPDAFTSLGGNQYVDSLAMGRWATFLTEELVPAVEARYRVRRGREHRGLFGKSSGGFGALYHALRHAEHWGAVACHSGDMAFEWAYLPHFPKTCDFVARHGGIEATLRHLRQARKLDGEAFHALLMLAMGASYDPDPQAPCGVRLPVDLYSCALIPERWEAWLAFDPVRLADDPECQRNLRSLRLLYLDCGRRDEYFLHYGARQFVQKLERHGIRHHYEEFDDTHTGIDYRMDRSLPLLYQAVCGTGAS